MKVGWLIDADMFDGYREELVAAIHDQGHDAKLVHSPSPPFRWDDVGCSYRETFPQAACVVAHGDIELMTRVHQERRWTPGAFCTIENFAWSSYACQYGRHLLNRDYVMLPFGEMLFWETLLTALAEREAKINPVLDASVVRNVLIKLARYTRLKIGDVGSLSIAEINQAFRDVTGLAPADESAVMLQRLPLLGRVASETTDRQFVDAYFLDGLRAEDVNQVVYRQDVDVIQEKWHNTLQEFGLRIVAAELQAAPDDSSFIRTMRSSAKGRNKILAGEIASTILYVREGDIDFGNLYLADTHIRRLDLSNRTTRNVTIDDSILDCLDITNASVENVSIRGCIIDVVEGVSQSQGLPDWVSNCSVNLFRSMSTVSRIKSAPLSLHQRIFVAIVKKTVFQPGAGRKEAALRRGFGPSVEKKAFQKVLNMLVYADVLKEIPGDEGFVYVPNRSHTKKMETILTQLTLSDDPLWKALPPD